MIIGMRAARTFPFSRRKIDDWSKPCVDTLPADHTCALLEQQTCTRIGGLMSQTYSVSACSYGGLTDLQAVAAELICHGCVQAPSGQGDWSFLFITINGKAEHQCFVRCPI